MSILLKGMEMPTDGYIDVRIKCNGTASFAIAKNPYFKVVEAIPVPPHGRLIDADAVISSEEGPYEYDDWCKWVLGKYQDAPTVIPADESDMDSFIRIFEEDDEDDEDDGMDSFIRILKD